MEYAAAIKNELQDVNFEDVFTMGSVITSLCLIGVILLTRRLLIRYVWRDTEILAKEQRSWIIRIKNISAALLVIGLILIWAPQLHTFALSIAAFAVALVIATKEMILCMMGALMRATSQPFKAGEWISIDGIVGEVVDMDAFSFRLHEVDLKGKSYNFTGRMITIPNSKLFSSNVENFDFFKAYIFEEVRIAVQHKDIDPDAACDALREIAEKHFAPHRTDAVAFNRQIRRRTGVGIGLAEPTFGIGTNDMGHIQFQTRLFVPTNAASQIRAAITRDFLSYVHKTLLAAKEGEAAHDALRQAPVTGGAGGKSGDTAGAAR